MVFIYSAVETLPEMLKISDISVKSWQINLWESSSMVVPLFEDRCETGGLLMAWFGYRGGIEITGGGRISKTGDYASVLVSIEFPCALM